MHYKNRWAHAHVVSGGAAHLANGLLAEEFAALPGESLVLLSAVSPTLHSDTCV